MTRVLDHQPNHGHASGVDHGSPTESDKIESLGEEKVERLIDLTAVDPSDPAPRTAEPAQRTADSDGRSADSDGRSAEPARVHPLAAGIVAFGLVAWSVASGNARTLIVALALGVMIFLHELGHFVTARLTGMKATEFFVGFGPRVWSFKRGETEYGIKAIPLGGYVKILGMTNIETLDNPADEARTYRQQSYPRRVLVASAGTLTHLLLAFVCFFSVASVFGERIETIDGLTVGAVEETINGSPSPAKSAGLRKGEVLLSIDGKAVEVRETPEGLEYNLPELLVGTAGRAVIVVVGDTSTYTSRPVTITPVESVVEGVSRARLGIRLDTKIGSVSIKRHDPIRGARFAGSKIVSLAPMTFQALGDFFSPDRLEKYSNAVVNADQPDAVAAINDSRFMSPVGTVNTLSAAAKNDFRDGIMLFAAINVFVGMFNMAPMMPLDGGHVLVATYERLRSTRKRRYVADVRKLMPAAYAVMFLMLLLGATSLYLDIRAPIVLP